MEQIRKRSGLEQAILILGGQSELAERLEVGQSAVAHWLQAGRVPADRVIAVSRATEYQVTPNELRPDIYPNFTDGMPA